MTQERIDIIVSEKGAREVKRNLADIGNGARSSTGPVNQLNDALKALATVATLRALQKTADGYTNIRNTLKTVTESTQQLNDVTSQLFDISQRTRTSFDTNAEAYRRFALAGRDLGKTQGEVLKFTETLNKAILLSGASAAEAQAGMIQLSQGLASGTLRGDELRSVLEQLPVVADIIAKQLGVTRGELRKMGEEGTITSEKIFEAFKNASEGIDGSFGKTVPTIAQGFTILQNSFQKYIGELDESLGISRGVVEVLGFMSDNVDILTKALLLGVTAWGTYQLIMKATLAFMVIQKIVGFAVAFVQLAAGVRTAAQAMALLNAAFLVNPIVLVVTIVASLIAAFVLFRKEIANLLRSWEFFGTNMLQIFQTIADVIIGTFRGALEVVKGVIAEIQVILFKFADKINKFLGEDIFDLSKIIGSDALRVMELQGRTAAENFKAGFDRSVSDGFLAKELEYQSQQMMAMANGGTTTNGQVIPGGQTGGGGLSAEAQKAMEDALKRQKKLLEEIKGPALNYSQTLGDLNTLLSTGQINAEEFTRALDKLNMSVLENDKTIGGGFQRGLLKVKEQFGDLSVLAENTLVNAFQEAEDALVKFVRTGELNFSEMVNSILDDLARLAIRQAIIQPLSNSLGSILGFKDGGQIPKFADGGLISGRGGPRDDKNLVAVSSGEYIVNANATRQFLPLLDMINGGTTAPRSYSSPGAAAVSGGASYVFAPVVQVNVEGGSSGAGGGDVSQGEAIAASVQRSLEGMFSDFLQKQQRPGGMLNRQETYG